METSVTSWVTVSKVRAKKSEVAVLMGSEAEDGRRLRVAWVSREWRYARYKSEIASVYVLMNRWE